MLEVVTKRRSRSGEPQVSPWMIYSMARRYDEFRGHLADSGSSVRGAMKGWQKHGACAFELWPELEMPPVPDSPTKDWWLDAVKRPLGAYYRIETRDLASIHGALVEVGVVVASCACHPGWDEGHGRPGGAKGLWEIPHRPLERPDGHAFAIVGYNQAGFIVHNSWGADWGSGGRAVLTYQDWYENAMDCWVGQLGVVTEAHRQLARTPTLRRTERGIDLPEDESLRNHQIAPYVINMENNGKLSDTGNFRTNPDDVRALMDVYLGRARTEWGLRDNDAVDIAIYAHGGLAGEDSAARTAAKWIPALYERRIFPVFLMWETGLVETLINMFRDHVEPASERVGSLGRWWNKRVEELVGPAGHKVWDEMKENGEAISLLQDAGGHCFYVAAESSPHFKLGRDRVHLIGHSAGAVVLCRLAEVFCRAPGWHFQSANFMAPAARVDFFQSTLMPLLESGRVKTYHQWHLSDALEQQDRSMLPLLFYSRSLLYLVSEALEGSASVPLVGMERYYDAMSRSPSMQAWAAVGPETTSREHGDFDEDEVTRRSVIEKVLSS